VSLAGTSVLVTGGAGFVGSHIVDRLVAEGCPRIVVLDDMVRGRPENLDDARRSGRVELVEGDIRDRQLMGQLVAGCDLVFHQAALRITHCAAEPRLGLEVMGNATFDLLELCVRNGVRRVVAASSASIYGMAEHFPTAEDHHPYGNRTWYGALKLFNEGMLRAFHDMHGLDYVALRYFNVYGPRMDLHGRYTEVLVRWMERIEAGQPPLIFGDGSQTMDFVHVRDVALANVRAATADASDVVLNVGCGHETSLRELAQLLAAAMDRPNLVPEHGPERDVNPVPRRLAATANAQRILGFATTLPLEEGLRELVAWWRSHRDEPATAPERAA
jgi:UDP-glucose 4-epimerase